MFTREEEGGSNTRVCKGGKKKKIAAVRIGLEKEKRETEDCKRVKRTFRFYLVCGRSKCAVLSRGDIGDAGTSLHVRCLLRFFNDIL